MAEIQAYLAQTRTSRLHYQSDYNYTVGDLEYRDRALCRRRAELADKLAEEASEPSRRAMFLEWAATWRVALLDATS